MVLLLQAHCDQIVDITWDSTTVPESLFSLRVDSKSHNCKLQSCTLDCGVTAVDSRRKPISEMGLGYEAEVSIMVFQLERRTTWLGG